MKQYIWLDHSFYIILSSYSSREYQLGREFNLCLFDEDSQKYLSLVRYAFLIQDLGKLTFQQLEGKIYIDF